MLSPAVAAQYRDNFTKKPTPGRSPRDPAPLLPSTYVPTVTTYGHDYIPKVRSPAIVVS